MPVISSRRLSAISAAVSAALAALAAARPAAAQTWNGSTNSNWSFPLNWSTFPASSANTALTFGAATNYTVNQDFQNPVILNSMTFTPGAAQAYTVQNLGINFDDNATLFASITQNSGQSVTFTNAVTLSSPVFAVGGSGAGTLFLNAPVGGTGTLNKSGSGTLSLGGANTFAGDVNVNGGVVTITNPAAVPAGRAVSVASGAEFRIGYTSGQNSTTPIGTLTLTGGTLRIPAGTGDFYLNRLSVLAGGALNFSGSSSSFLRLFGTGAGIDVFGNATWTGGGASRILNDSPGVIDLTVTGGTLTNGIPLSFGAFRVTGGGTLAQTGGNTNAPIVVDAATYQVADLSFITTGSLTLQGNGTLTYAGSGSATLSKDFALGAGGGRIVTSNTLFLSGTISETGGTGRGLTVAGGPVVLSGANTYTGPTTISGNAEAGVATLPNGGVAGPLGQSSSAAGNLVIGNGILRYTGLTGTSDRGFTVSDTSSRFEVATAGVNLTVGGQVTGAGALNKTGPGTLTLTNSTTNYTGGTVISAGRLKLGTASADQLPAGGNVTVAAGATFDVGSPSGTANFNKAIGTITLNGGTMTAGPLGDTGAYDATALVMTGGTLDLSQTSPRMFAFRLRTGVTVNAGNTTAVWTGNENAFVQNAGTGALTISVGKGTTPSGIDLDSGLSLTGITANPFIVKSGPGVMRMTEQRYLNTKLTVAEGTLRLDDVGVFDALTGLDNSSLTLAGGTFQYGGPTATAAANPLTLGAGGGTIEVPTAGATLTLPGAVGGTGGLTKTGPGTLTLDSPGNTYSGGTTVAAGTLAARSITGPSGQMTGATTVAAGATLVADSVVQQSFIVNGQAGIRTKATGGATSAVKVLTLAGVTGAWTGRLDLADTALVIDYDLAGGSPLSTVADQIASGRAGGAWTGPGIRSSSAGGSLSLGVAEASRALGAGGGTFQGVTVDGSAVLVRLTRIGDANVDGSVNGSDLSLLLNNFGATSGRTWQDGDFNYDRAVNGSDLSLLLNNFGGSAGLTALTADEAARVAALGGDDVSVPEPGGLITIAAALGAPGLLPRHRSRARRGG